MKHFNFCRIISLTFIITLLSLIPTAVQASTAYTKKFLGPTIHIGLIGYPVDASDALILHDVIQQIHKDVKNETDIKKTFTYELNYVFTSHDKQQIIVYIVDTLSAMDGKQYKGKLMTNDTTTTIKLSRSTYEIEMETIKHANIIKNLNKICEIVREKALKNKSSKTFEINKVANLDLKDKTDWYTAWTIGQILSDYCRYNYKAAMIDKPASQPEIKKEISVSEEYENDKSAYSAYGLFDKRLGVCVGISAFTTMLCDELGIPCTCISGKSSSNSDYYHQWNQIYLDGKWYFLDFTRIIGNGSVENSNAISTEEEFQRMGYQYSPYDAQLLRQLKYPNLYKLNREA